ncbi:hypothetical protein B296_00049548 [Ensete ventricosum]|uniref:Uncharacterized protein n=1 Tax=Ensete ventricosum TaxID=4639 RepID=A0A426WYI3_ENSVE|nr:hypothetical protein B296_00049548 [Ensete ventricosum]
MGVTHGQLGIESRGEGSKEEGWLATARPRPRPASKGRPSAGVATRRGSACRHDGLRPTHKGGSRPQRGARKGSRCRAACASGGRQQPACKGLPPVCKPQGVTSNDQAARGGCPQHACRGAVANDQPPRGYRLRWGNDDNGVEGSKERARASF